MTNMEENDNDHEGDDDNADEEDDNEAENDAEEDNEDEDEDGVEQHNQLLLCVHSFGEVVFGEQGALVFWLPHDRCPKDPEHCDPSKFKYKWRLDSN